MACRQGSYGLVPSKYTAFRKKSINPLISFIVQIVLFGADFVQALGAVMDIRWINTGVVVTGTYCTAQGITLLHLFIQFPESTSSGSIQQLGETSVAMITLVCTFDFLSVIINQLTRFTSR